MPEIFALSTESLLIIALIVFIGGMIKGFLGFGMPIFATPLLALFMPLLAVIPLMAVPVLFSNIYQAKLNKPFKQYFSRFWPLGLFQITGVVIGVQILVSANTDLLKLGLGLIVICNVCLRIFKLKLRIPSAQEGYFGPFGGLVAGFVGGTTSFVGPLLVLYLSSLENLKKDDFVRVIAFLYLGGFIPMYGGLAVLDAFTWQQLAGSAAICLPMLTGVYYGERLRSVISENLFERAVMLTLGSVALSLIYQSAINLF
ncbi:sulfite exporter TauE/SafE family protein [Litorivicinus sp.]|nr:sulfite exporter TauE/SafE family protein [Litorivicinus sp.]MDC1240938.1 sulfite exporter TauE/SafE family protein [Litorivicinus sp.]